jgi:sulfonate transport system substrate-binding protein
MPLSAVALVAVTALLAGCGSKTTPSAGAANTSKSGATTPPTVPTVIPPGTTLRVGDQLDFLKTILSTAGEDKDLPYKLEWSGFIGGPPMLQAFHADAIDAGFVADTPLIFAQAAHQDVKAIAGWASEHGSLELIAAAGRGIDSWADLKGKKVALQRGTVAEAAVLQGLDGVGLKLGDIDVVDLPITQISAALQGSSVDAGLLAPPLDTAYLTSNRGAKIVDQPSNLTARVNFLIASTAAIEDPAKAAALNDYIARFGKALAKIKADPDQFVKNFYVAKYGLTLEAGKALLAKQGASTFISLSGDLIPAQQELADLYTAAGEIPDKLDVAQEFDTRFANAIKQAAAG